jgi:hypothetical protein
MRVRSGLVFGQIAFGGSSVSLAGAQLDLTASNYNYQPGDILYLITNPTASGWAPGSTYLDDQDGNPILNGDYYTIAGTDDRFLVTYLADPGVELQADPAAVPEASTATMLTGAALTAMGYALVRRIRRPKHANGADDVATIL